MDIVWGPLVLPTLSKWIEIGLTNLTTFLPKDVVAIRLPLIPIRTRAKPRRNLARIRHHWVSIVLFAI